ncbi:hypothetical protein MIND_01184400 [Mycena indigotica]|nr:uncharacterized protein MIND_01184400 [Mycena indigotica]KAF7292854.1 hypothetical protein MIND_01184400 [Mycena indigotica]
MSALPARRSILNLYSSMLRVSRSFSSYNFRNYFVDRTKDKFRLIQNEKDSARVQTMYDDAVAELAVLRRSAAVNRMYGGWRLAVEPKKTPQHIESI